MRNKKRLTSVSSHNVQQQHNDAAAIEITNSIRPNTAMNDDKTTTSILCSSGFVRYKIK